MAIKRARIDYDRSNDEKNTVSHSGNQFNFIPTLNPSQRIFDLDNTSSVSQPPAELSINTLTQRFKDRLEKSKRGNTVNMSQVALVTPHQSEKPYEPRYIKHQELAYTIIIYIQMAFNVIISSTVIYLFIKIIIVVKQDFNLKAKEHLDSLHKEKLVCTNNYLINHCGENDRIPALEKLCNEWAVCMNRDTAVPQAKVSAEAIAEIINSFVEPISFKTMLFFSLLIVGTLIFSNVAIKVFKRNYELKQN